MSDLRFGLVGCGRVARKHVDAIAHTDGARISAVCDIRPERARELGEQLGVPWFASLADMLAKARDIDVVAVLTPSGHHAEHAVAAAARGKHVIVEKPLALRVEDADDMIVACDRAGVKLFVVKPTRYHAPVQQLRRALEAGRFGKLVLGTVRVRWCRRQDYYDRDDWRGKWELDGGVLANQASHYIDLLMWMFGQVESVSAMTATRLVDIETEDTAAVLLRFANGALGIVEATTAARPVGLEGSLSVLGEKGSVVIGGFSVDELATWQFEDRSPEDDAIVEALRVRTDNTAGHRAFVRDVVRAIGGQGAALVDGLEARKSVEVITAIYEAVQTRREVALRYHPQRR